MNKEYIGKVVNTHGIKGEIRILSSFPYKDKVFVVNNEIIIGSNNYIITSYRKHKNYDMITLKDYNDINEVLFLLKEDVYILRENLHLDDNQVLDSKLMTYKVLFSDNTVGSIIDIFDAGNNNKVIRVLKDGKELLVSINSDNVKIDIKKEEISINLIEGM